MGVGFTTHTVSLHTLTRPHARLHTTTIIPIQQVFLEWYEEGEERDGRSEFTRREVTAEMAQALRKGAEKFITWLTEADESDDDDDGGSDSEGDSEEEEASD